MTLSCASVQKWESGDVLPEQNRIGTIAEYYEIPEDVLEQAFLLAKKERNAAVDFRKNLRKKPRPQKIGTFSGEIMEMHMNHYLNRGLNVVEDNK